MNFMAAGSYCVDYFVPFFLFKFMIRAAMLCVSASIHTWWCAEIVCIWAGACLWYTLVLSGLGCISHLKAIEQSCLSTHVGLAAARRNTVHCRFPFPSSAILWNPTLFLCPRFSVPLSIPPLPHFLLFFLLHCIYSKVLMSTHFAEKRLQTFLLLYC